MRYADLYLELEEEDLSRDELDRGNLEYVDKTQEEVKDFLENRMEGLLEEWKNGVVDGLAKSMDYCVIDHDTGEVLKNTAEVSKSCMRTKLSKMRRHLMNIMS